MSDLQELIKEQRVWYCLDCGKCGSVCPVSRWEGRLHTSPRLLIDKAIHGSLDEVMDDCLFWSCLTCKRCSQLCPSDVHFSEFLRAARGLAQRGKRRAACTHSETIQTWGRMMADRGLRQQRLGWLEPGLKVSPRSDTLYFVGCLPYYDPLFRPLGFEGLEIARAAVRILNHLGIQPQVLADERCCGHDQLWEGEVETFRTLAMLNLERFKSSGARRIVTTCPECARTLKLDYPQLITPHGLQVVHLAELLAENDLPPVPPPAAGDGRVTYQDPCRLGRHLGVYDAPRRVIAGLGFELLEMERRREASLCCGTSGWTTCGQVSKNIQVERLEEARATGAQQMVTACIKCQIHFRCAQADPARGEQPRMQVRDLTTLVAERLSLSEAQKQP